MKISKKWVFTGIILLSLFLIFFVGRSTNPETGKRELAITTNGVTQFRKGLDVSGGTRLVYKISYDKYESLYTDKSELAAVKKMIEEIIYKNIDKRISKLGVSDYKAYVQKLDNQNYIVVEIGGIADLDQAKDIIGKTLELEFKLKNTAPVDGTMYAQRKQIAQNLYTEIVKDPQLMQRAVDGRASENIYFGVYSGTVNDLPDIYKNNIAQIQAMQTGTMYKGLLEGLYTKITTQDQLGNATGFDLKGFAMMQLLDKKTEVISGKTEQVYLIADVFVQDRLSWVAAQDDQGNVLNGAYFKFANPSSSQVGEPVVAINFDDKGKDVFCKITEKSIGNPMAIFVGGQMLTSPTIQAKICGGTAQIDGSFTIESAKELSSALNDGAMPAPLILMQEEKINPSLGVNALTGALIAGLIGIFAIGGLIFLMYGFRKMVLTLLVLLAFVTVLAGFLKLTDYALSLAGIAAIILAIGMAVDGNILIYERLREELKAGKSIEGAIDHAKERSWTAIRDGQLSTGVIALVLFSMGVNIFKGFGFMMMVTLVLSLFFNVPLTKMLLHMFYDRKKD